MAEQIRLGLRSMLQGMVTFACPWSAPYYPPVRERRGVSHYLSRMGGYLIGARRSFEDQYLGEFADAK